MNKEIIIIGASGHGKVIADIALKVGYKKIAFLDDDITVKSCMEYPVVGIVSDSIKYADFDFVVAIGNSEIREKIMNFLIENKLNVVSLVHPNATMAENVKIGVGCVIMAGAVINSDTSIGQGVIINTCASVDHDCEIGDFTHISVGSHVCGTVNIGKQVWLGAGSTVINNVNVCNGCIIGAGAVVVKNIENSGKYVGIPAKEFDR